MTDQQSVSQSLRDGNGQSESKSTFFHPRASPHIPEASCASQKHAPTDSMTQHSYGETKRSSFNAKQNNLVTVDVCESAAASYAIEKLAQQAIAQSQPGLQVTFPADSATNQMSAERAVPSMRIDNYSSVMSDKNENADEQRSYKSSAFLQEKNSTIVSHPGDKKSSIAYSEQRTSKLNAMSKNAMDFHDAAQRTGDLQSSIQNYRNLRSADGDDEEPPINIHCDFVNTGPVNQRILRDSQNTDRTNQMHSATFKQSSVLDMASGVAPKHGDDTPMTMGQDARRSVRSSLYVETEKKPHRDDTPDDENTIPQKSVTDYQPLSQHAKRYLAQQQQNQFVAEPSKVQINFQSHYGQVEQKGDEALPSESTVSVNESKRASQHSVSNVNAFSAVQAYQLHAASKNVDLSPTQAEKFGGSFGKHDRGTFYFMNMKEEQEDIFNQPPRFYKSFQSKQSIPEANQGTATLGTIETSGVHAPPQRSIQVTGERPAVTNSRQTWQSVVIKNQVKQPAGAETSVTNRYDQMNIRMLRDKNGTSALTNELAMKTLSQGSDGNVEVGSNFQKSLGVSPIQPQSRMTASPTFRSKSNERRSSANLCQASFDKAQELIRRAKSRRQMDSKPPVSQSHNFESYPMNPNANSMSASMNRMHPFVSKYGKDEGMERKTASSLNRGLPAANPFIRSQNDQSAKYGGGQVQFHPKLSNMQSSYERNTNSQHLLKTYKRLHGFKEEEPTISKVPSKSSLERYKGFVPANPSFDFNSPYQKSDEKPEPKAEVTKFMPPSHARTDPQLPNRVISAMHQVVPTAAVKNTSAERYFNNPATGTMQNSFNQREALIMDSYARDLKRADPSPPASYILNNQSSFEESRQPVLSNGRYGSTSPTDRAQINNMIATTHSVGLSPIQQTQAAPVSTTQNAFNIERVRYQKDLDAELRACNDIILKLQNRMHFVKPATKVESVTSPTQATAPVSIAQDVTHKRKRTKSQLDNSYADFQPEKREVVPSEPTRLCSNSEMVQQPADSVSHSWMEALNGNKMHIQEIDSFRQMVNSSRNPKPLDPQTIILEESSFLKSKEEAPKLIPLLNVENLATKSDLLKPAIVSAAMSAPSPMTKQRSVSPGQAPIYIDLTAEYGACKSSWFTQMYEELQAKKKMVTAQDQIISELRQENDRLRTMATGMPDFIERIEALINAQGYFKKAAKLTNSTPSSIMNSLEVLLCHSSMAERQMQRQLEDQDKVIETLKKLMTFQEKQAALNSQSQQLATSTDNVPNDGFMNDLMDKIAFVDELHDKMQLNLPDQTSDVASADTQEKKRIETSVSNGVKTARTGKYTVFYKERNVQTDIDSAAFKQLVADAVAGQAPDQNLTSVLSGELQKHLQNNLREIATIKLENGQLMEKAKHESKLNGKLKTEVRRLQRYEAFFEKQKMKKYRNCGCQIGSSKLDKTSKKDQTKSDFSLQHSSTYAYGADKKLLKTNDSVENKNTLSSVNVPAAIAGSTQNKENGSTIMVSTSGHKASRNNFASKLPSELSSLQTPNNALLQQHIKQTQELHNMLKTFLARAQTDKSGQLTARPEDEELLMRSKSILQSIDESANRISHGYQQSTNSIAIKAEEVREQMEEMLTADKASEFLEQYDSRGSIKKSIKTRSRKDNGDLSSASMAQISRKSGLSKKKTVKASPSPDLSASRGRISTNKSALGPPQFNQSNSVNALDTALKKQLASKMSETRTAKNVSSQGMSLELKDKTRPPTRNASKLKDLRQLAWRRAEAHSNTRSRSSITQRSLEQAARLGKRDMSKGSLSDRAATEVVTTKSCDKLNVKRGARLDANTPEDPKLIDICAQVDNCDAYEQLLARAAQFNDQVQGEINELH